MLKYIDPDKIFLSYTSVKIKLLILFGFFVTVYWAITNTNPWWLNLVYFYVALSFGRTFSEIGLHRLFSHRSFETSKFKRNVLLIGGTLLGIGSCLTYVGVHRTHHRYADTSKDPHSPKNIGVIRTWLTLWDKDWSIDFATVKDLIRDPLQMFLHRNYFKILLTWIALLSTISIVIQSIMPLLLLFAMPNTVTFVLAGYTNAIGHTAGYRNFDTDDGSMNNHSARFLLLSAGLHNNHHAYPSVWDYNIRKKWFEFDIEGMVIKHFFMKK